MITFQRTALLRFYDDKQDLGFQHRRRGAHVSAITGVIGEELLLELLCHYFKYQRPAVHCEVLPDKPRRRDEPIEGKRGSGNWLDAWVKLGAGHLAQVEIKNWSAHSLGGKTLALDATDAVIEADATARWKSFFGDNDKMPSSARKILLDYPMPGGIQLAMPVERILCFWQPVVQDSLKPMSNAVICGKEISVFSASIYLRQLEMESIELDCPDVEERLRVLEELQRTFESSPNLRAVA
ncbi:MAG: hypothetical protein JSS56_07720 [Proteobacteria bacterium]|nr:hypothetical protein [Pseudomonadota bacterium]